jgi:hypothetical protein
MHPPIHSVFHPELMGTWLILLAFGAYHGINPGMGWLFALSLGLQQRSQRAVWGSLLPIAAGHAVSILLVVGLIVLAGQLIPLGLLRLLTALVLLGFGIYKLLTYYRHPRWVGMRVGWRDLFVWSFLMATAHGAGLMVAPALLSILKTAPGSTASDFGSQLGMMLGVSLHTLAMLTMMAAVAALVYWKLGLSILRRGWVNFDLIWAVALLLVGATALVRAIA